MQIKSNPQFSFLYLNNPEFKKTNYLFVSLPVFAVRWSSDGQWESFIRRGILEQVLVGIVEAEDLALVLREPLADLMPLLRVGDQNRDWMDEDAD